MIITRLFLLLPLLLLFFQPLFSGKGDCEKKKVVTDEDETKEMHSALRHIGFRLGSADRRNIAYEEVTPAMLEADASAFDAENKRRADAALYKGLMPMVPACILSVLLFQDRK